MMRPCGLSVGVRVGGYCSRTVYPHVSVSVIVFIFCLVCLFVPSFVFFSSYWSAFVVYFPCASTLWKVGASPERGKVFPVARWKAKDHLRSALWTVWYRLYLYPVSWLLFCLFPWWLVSFMSSHCGKQKTPAFAVVGVEGIYQDCSGGAE